MAKVTASKKLTVFSILDTPAIGGAEENLLTGLSYLKSRGHHVILATNQSDVKRRATSLNLQVLHFPFRLDAIGNWKGLVKFLIWSPVAIGWLLKQLWPYRHHQNQSPFVCYLPGFSDRLLFSPLIKRLGIPLVWLEHGPLEPTFQRNFGFPQWLYHLNRNLPDSVVVISKTTRQSLVTTGQLKPEKITIIYPSVVIYSDQVIKAFQKKAHQWLANRQWLPFQLVVAVGRLAQEKEFNLLLRAWSKIPMNVRQKTRLLIIGDGPAKTELEDLARHLSISDETIFTGYVDQTLKVGLVASSQLFIFPSAWELEGFGLTTAEAMSLAVPVITSGVGPQAEVVQDQKTGWYFSPHTPEALADQITTILKNRTAASKIALRGQATVIKKFSAHKMHHRLEQVLLSATAT